jgi:hypothetical protein
MKHGNAFLLLPVIITLSLLAAFVITAPVFAQDELPPEAPAPTETTPVEEDTLTPPPAPPVVVTPVEETAVDTVIQDIAEAGLALADGEGQPIPFASEQAADALVDPDPWFKVGTVTYSFTLADCDPGPGVSACLNPLQAAVDYISVNGKIPSDGFIHVDAGTLPNQKVTVDGTQPYLNSLKGIVGVVDRDTLNPESELSFTDAGSGSWIRIFNKVNGFTISGLDISGDVGPTPDKWGVIDIENSAGSILLQDLVVNNDWSSGSGIRILNHNGSVTIKNVDSSDNAGGGAYIENLLGTAGVTVTNSSFDDNQSSSFSYPASGLHIKTNGAVSISGVSASRNLAAHPGLWIEGGTTVTIKSSQANGNTAGRGIDIQTPTGRVLLTNVTANGNNLTGLYVRSKGAISISGIDASQNLGLDAIGADLDNTGSTSVVSVDVTNGTFENNYTTGLQIYTKGNIILTNTASWDNDSTAGSYGADLNNASGTGYVKITNLPSTDMALQPGFNNNHDRGVNIHTNGLVTLTNVNALNNQEEGIFVWTELNKGVTLTNCRADGNMTSFGTAGIYISSVGPIVINGGHAYNNSGYGVWAHNEIAVDSAPKAVTISNFTADHNMGYGIRIESKGAIKLTNVTANLTHGASEIAISLDNDLLTAGVTLSNIIANDNNYDGIVISTKGTVSLTKVTADRNGRYGAWLSQIGTAFPTTTITTGSFSDNSSYGLVVYGRGAITLKDISANDNAGNGAYIENVSGNVSLLASSTGGNSFSYNHGIHDGLDINTRGAVTLNKVTASGNADATGVFLYSTATGYVGNVVINGGAFNGYLQDYGLIARSNGTITVSDLVAEDNDITGITLTNTYDVTGAKGITINRTWVYSNGGKGLEADSYGLITVNTITALENSGNGVDLDNSYGAFLTPKGISILGGYGTSNVSGNLSIGLYIRTDGNVTVTKLNANTNTDHGIDINNSTGKGTISLSYVTTNSNGLRGMQIYSNNAVTISSITALFNAIGIGSSAVYVDTNDHNFTISNSLVSGNGYYGIWGELGLGIFKMTNTFYFGNNVTLGSGNIMITH